MQIVFNVPANLQGQSASNILDPGLAGQPRGDSAIAGKLGTTITLPASYAPQAYKQGFTFSSWTTG